MDALGVTSYKIAASRDYKKVGQSATDIMLDDSDVDVVMEHVA